MSNSRKLILPFGEILLMATRLTCLGFFVALFAGCQTSSSRTSAYYSEYLSTPNIPEVCRAAGRPSDMLVGRDPAERKDAALRAVKTRNITCDWSQIIADWHEYKLSEASRPSAPAAQRESAVFLRSEWASPDFQRCVYNDGSSTLRPHNMRCRSTK